MPYTWFIRVPGLVHLPRSRPDGPARAGRRRPARRRGRGLAGPAGSSPGPHGAGPGPRSPWWPCSGPWRRAGRAAPGVGSMPTTFGRRWTARSPRTTPARSWWTCRSASTSSRRAAANPDAQAILMATDDGHPRAVTYSSWVPSKTIAAISTTVLLPAQPGAARLRQVGRRRSRRPGRPADPARRLAAGVAARARPGPVPVPVGHRLPLRLPGGRGLGLPARRSRRVAATPECWAAGSGPTPARCTGRSCTAGPAGRSISRSGRGAPSSASLAHVTAR